MSKSKQTSKSDSDSEETSKYILSRSTRSGKKWQVETPNGKTVHFGARGYEDYTMHQDSNRKANYLSRHEARENWEKSGLNTAGFWSRWLLWNKKTLDASIKDIENRFGVEITHKE